MQKLTSQFLFAACAPDCQELVKHEMIAGHGLRLAFSRPGLLTFKTESPVTLAEAPRSRIASLGGLSLGTARTLPELIALVRPLIAHGQRASSEGDAAPESPRLTAGSSDPSRADLVRAYPWPAAEDEVGPSEARLAEVSDSLERALPVDARLRDFELGVLVPSDSHASFGYFAFARPRGTPRLTPKVTPPPEAPSRAYSKLVEAIHHFSITLSPGTSALELGAAPGGATFALLERGVSVLAVDPADMDARLAPYAEAQRLTLRHLKKPAQALDTSDLNSFRPRWLISDMNVAPPVSAQYVQRARALMKGSLKGAILTLKLNDTAAVDALPRVLAELERAFGSPPTTAHLPSHRREVVAVFEA